jgi:plastocyanin
MSGTRLDPTEEDQLKSRRTMLALAATAALGASALAIGPALAQGPAQAKLKIVGGTTVKPGKFVKDTQRFAPSKRAVRSGGTVRLANKARTEDPHTLSLVRKSDLPSTPQTVFECEVCEPFFGAHDPNEETGEFGTPVVDVGEEGFDRPGDSVFVAPGETVRFDVSAPKGTTLYYLCAFHAWMQGKLRVK